MINFKSSYKKNYFINNTNIFYEKNTKKRINFLKKNQFFYTEISKILKTIIDDTDLNFFFCCGNSSIINEFDSNKTFIQEINDEILNDIDHIYMESYLWDHDLTKKTLQKFGDMAKEKNNETSLSLSDRFCVDRHRDELKDFIAKNVDLIFCNFDEAKMFSQCETMADVGLFFKAFGKKVVMTSGAEGAFYFFNEEVSHQSVEKVENVVDTTGAGDNFAAGFLDYYLSGKTIDEALKNGNTRAVEVIQQLGPRIKRS